MVHVLDNPGWNALISGNKNLSAGNEQVKYFSREVSPFVGLRDNSADDFRQLYEIIPYGAPIGFISPVEREVPAEWQVLRSIHCLQMIHEGVVPPANVEMEIVHLTVKHVPQMVALAKLTKPGPFDVRTIEFGHYYGIFDDDKLVAMAGQRLHIFEYAEISAVCTHPDYLGRGYAKQLLIHHLHRIINAGENPILHVRADNERAIKVYESLSFAANKEIFFYFLQKNKLQ
jgi:predicted GNAT family acetyltransferase